MTMKIEQDELDAIKAKFPTFEYSEIKQSKELKGNEVSCLIVIPVKYKHKESGCRYLKVLALDWGSPPNFYSLGWHDSFEFVNSTSTIDYIGQNVMRIYAMRPMKLNENFVSRGTIAVYNAQNSQDEVIS